MFNLKAYLIFICCCFYGYFCEDISIDLSLFHPNEHEYSYLKKYYDIKSNMTAITVQNVQPDVGFLVLQVHTYVENVTLSSQSILIRGSYATGTNIGLVEYITGTTPTFYLFRDSPIQPTAHVLIVINVYDQEDPVPGGCNLSFDTEIAPYQMIDYDDHLITVKYQPASTSDLSCDNNTIQLEMYHLFLYEYDNSIATYFSGIEKMVSIDDILKHGRKVNDMGGVRKYKTLYSSYIGTGEVFAVISTYQNRKTAYVPIVSYGCDVSKWNEHCVGPVALHWKVLCAFQLFFGIFLCFFGHRFFKITLYVVSFTFGLMVTYFVISIEEYLSTSEKTITSFTVGFIYGIIWLYIWRNYGMPFLVVHLAFLLSGFLAASLLFYTVLADLSIFRNGVYFWITYSFVMCLSSILSLCNAMYGHITSLCFISSYASVMALNYYVGGNLPYILINTYRRVAVKHYNVAVISPPLQVIDVLHALSWFALAIFGMFVQIRHQRNRPPFPPNREFRDIDSPLPPIRECRGTDALFNRLNRQCRENDSSTERTPLIFPINPTAPPRPYIF